MNSNYIKSLRIIYFALAMGIVLFMLVSLLINNLNGALAESDISGVQKAPFLIVLVVMTGGIFMVYKTIFPKKLETIKLLPTLDRKLAAWRELNVLKGALIEAPAFFATVLFMLLGVYALLVWPVAGLAVFWLSQPTRERLIIEANLSPNEIIEFDALA